MIVDWRNNFYECRRVNVQPSYIRTGDWLIYDGELTKVEAIQTECPSLERLSRKFTMYTLETREGRLLPVRNLQGTREVFKKNWRLVK